MPNRFTLNDKETGKPEKFASIDDRMREHFGAEPDDTNWYLGWYDTLGLAFAMGKSWEQIEEMFHDDEPLQVIGWLKSNYDIHAWAEIGKR